MDLNIALKKIKNFAKETLNAEQKKIAESILKNSCNENGDVDDKVLQFIIPIIKTGFVFDKAPEVDQDNIAIVEESKNYKKIGTSGPCHSLIIGENYEALKNLKLVFSRSERGNIVGFIDIIYIDPPYNTQKSKEEGNDYKEEIKSFGDFIYRDKYKRTGWLNMMDERLRLAKDLLTDDGVIFISIDDSECSYLKVLCDEIFGEENFVTSIPRLTRTGRGGQEKYLCKAHDYVLVYSFDVDFNYITEKLMLGTDILKDEYGREYFKGDSSPIVAGKSQGYSKGGDYDFEYQGKIYSPNDKSGNRNRWLWNKTRMEAAANLGILVPVGEQLRQRTYIHWKFESKGPNKNTMVRKHENWKFNSMDFFLNKPVIDKNFSETEKNSSIKNLLKIDNQYTNDKGTAEVKKIFPDYAHEKLFNFPKPLALIKQLIKLKVNNKNAIILDFFAGSGTTGEAVMELNEEDSGSRRCILVTNNENNIAKDITYERLYRVINGKGSNNQEIKWKYSSTKPSLTNNTVNIFEINHYPCGINENPDYLQNLVKSELIKINPDVKFNDIQLNRDLSSLNPYDKSKLNKTEIKDLEKF
ncbi:site-specific DNA-methyltransferase [Mycoplasma sp. SG1]|uniref:site-specific DNA-methyltransferase n=1 Tax=Mycoplasma sp. SG1 TaxID=2810348 RepID=UPI0020243C7F|nr:site-specific DNA-methyltransferase [Mycoplasma sp. SG1]URM52984.1 site-specific DNA-methyltransferase [Mycoplasma sp. SG1]